MPRTNRQDDDETHCDRQSPDDLISIGVIGLIKAVNSFKPHSGTALGTYAARCIENAIPHRRDKRVDVDIVDILGCNGKYFHMLIWTNSLHL